MPAARFYVTTTIPYVNARPHLGFALELVQADVLARHHRPRGDEVRFLTGTDDNSLKNVLAAEAEGLPTQELVDRNAAAFAGAARAAGAVLRRLHPHQPRPPPPAGSGALLARLRRGRRPLPQALRGAVLRRLRAVLHPRRAARWPLPGTRHAGRSPSPRRTGSSACPATRPAPRPDQQRAAARSNRPRAATRCSASSPPGWRTSASPGRSPAPAAGASRCPTTRTRSSTSGGTRWATTSPPWTTAQRRRRVPALVGAQRPAGAPARQGRAALPRRLLAGDAALGRANRCPPTSSCTTT